MKEDLEVVAGPIEGNACLQVVKNRQTSDLYMRKSNDTKDTPLLRGREVTPELLELSARLLHNEYLSQRQAKGEGVPRTYFSGGESVYDAWFIMSYVEGQPLDEIRLSEDETFRVLSELGQTIQHVHEQGVRHNDVTRGNVVVPRIGRTQLLDFGSAKRDSVDYIAEGLGVINQFGTPEIAAPEQFLHSPHARTDMWLFAATVYETIGERLAVTPVLNSRSTQLLPGKGTVHDYEFNRAAVIGALSEFPADLRDLAALLDATFTREERPALHHYVSLLESYKKHFERKDGSLFIR